MTTITIPAAGAGPFRQSSLRALSGRLGITGVSAVVILSVLVFAAVDRKSTRLNSSHWE